MRLHVFGIGGAGARVVDRLHADHADQPFLDGSLAFDTDRGALDALVSLPEASRYRFADRVGGTGLDGDLRSGFDVGADHAGELSRVVDTTNPSRAEAFLVVVGLGGATGGGCAPALVRDLRRLYDVPVYVLGVLPPGDAVADPEAAHVDGSSTEPTAGASSAAGSDRGSEGAWHDGDRPDPDPRRPLALENAERTLRRLDGLANAVLLFDADQWLRRDETMDEGADRLDGVLSDHVAALFGAGHAVDGGATPQQVVDASDVNRALGDRSAFASIGRAEQAIDRPATGSRFGLGIFAADEPAAVDTSEAVSVVETVIRKAARGKGTVGVPDGRAERTLLIVGGPPEWLNRDAIARGRRWLASEAGSDAVLSGDAPDPDAESVYAVVLRSGIDPPERLSATGRTRE